MPLTGVCVGPCHAQRWARLPAHPFGTCRRRPLRPALDQHALAEKANPVEAFFETQISKFLDNFGRKNGRKRAPFDDEYVFGLLTNQKQHLILAGVCLLFCTASNLAAPVLSGLLIDALITRQPTEKFSQILAILTVGYLVEPLLTRVYMHEMLRAGEKVLAALRLELFRLLLMQRIEFFDRRSASELSGLIGTDLECLRSCLVTNCSRDRGPRAFLEAFGAVCVLFCLSWQLAPSCIIAVTGGVIAATHFRTQSKTVEQKLARAMQRMVGVAHQAFDNIRTVRSFAGEPLERERFHTQVSRAYRNADSYAAARATLEASNRAAIHISLLVLYAMGGYLVASGLMPVSTLVAGIGFTFSLQFATQGCVNSLGELRRAAAAWDRVRGLLQSSEPDPSMHSALPPGAWWEVANSGAPPTPPTPYGAAASDSAVLAARHGALELRNVCFAYPERPNARVLDGVSITLARGTVTALVGRSGAGKSTVAALLSRFYEPQDGGVFLDGQPAASFTRGEWTKAISMVGQEPVLFAGTVAENICYGGYEFCSFEQVQAAAEAANADEFITRLSDGYNTEVGERGLRLSGGQRQRVALARALLKDSPVLVLDEATSALDAVSERLVQQAVARLVRDRTVLVIAHRLSTVQSADNVLVLDGGRVVEAGTHKQLLALGGRYAQLMSSQDLILGAT